MGCCTLSGFVNTGLVLAGTILLEGVRTESHWIVGRGWIARPDADGGVGHNDEVQPAT